LRHVDDGGPEQAAEHPAVRDGEGPARHVLHRQIATFGLGRKRRDGRLYVLFVSVGTPVRQPPRQRLTGEGPLAT
jgi:hypothetical protein